MGIRNDFALDPDQVRQVLSALLEVQRSGYGTVKVRIEKHSIRIIQRCFDDKAVPSTEWRLRQEAERAKETVNG